MLLSNRIDSGEFTNTMDRSSSNREAWWVLEHELRAKFRKALEEEVSFKEKNPFLASASEEAKRNLFNLAWEKGHSEGLYDVWAAYTDLYDVLRLFMTK